MLVDLIKSGLAALNLARVKTLCKSVGPSPP
jgi:hypothetical protein